MGVCNCTMFCCMLLYVHSSIAIILMWKRELIALLNLSSWCFVMVERLFLAVPRGSLQFVIVVFPDHTHLLFFTPKNKMKISCMVMSKCMLSADRFVGQHFYLICTKLYRQVVGIPMGNNCAPLVADYSCFVMRGTL